MSSSDQGWIKRARWLTQALIISGTLNIGFLTTFIYIALKEKQRPLPLEVAKAVSKTLDTSTHLNLQQLLSKYSMLSFQDLMLRLGNSDHVESGYTKRDAALACLVAFHHFNLEKALGGLKLQRRTIAFTNSEAGEKIQLDMFPGLADYQYQAIASYAKTEKWPLTSQGLFFELKSMTPPYEETLLEAFYLMPEFHFLNTLFAKTGVVLKKESMIFLLLGGKWETVREYGALLRSTSEFTVHHRREFLLQLIDEGSRFAARLFLKLDEEFALRRFDDDQMLAFLDLLDQKAPPAFVHKLLSSPRSDQVWKKASEAIDHSAEIAQAEQQKEKSVEQKIHIVAPGESLWKIAKKYNISVKELQEKNALTTDRLRPGQELSIAQGT